MSSHLRTRFWLLLSALATLTHCLTLENLPLEQELPDGGKIWVSYSNPKFKPITVTHLPHLRILKHTMKNVRVLMGDGAARHDTVLCCRAPDRRAVTHQK